MKKIQRFAVISAIILFSFFAGLTGCNSTLEKDGAYATAGALPDKAFYVADAAFGLTYSAIDAAFTFEKNNRVALFRLSPEIKHGLDKIRPTAKLIVIDYANAREAYLKSPTPAGLSLLNTILAKAQQLSNAAQTLLPKQ